MWHRKKITRWFDSIIYHFVVRFRSHYRNSHCMWSNELRQPHHNDISITIRKCIMIWRQLKLCFSAIKCQIIWFLFHFSSKISHAFALMPPIDTKRMQWKVEKINYVLWIALEAIWCANKHKLHSTQWNSSSAE